MTNCNIKELYYVECNCFTHPWTEKMLESELKNPLSILVTEEQNGMTVAYSLGRVTADEGELLKICVLSEYRKSGIAEKLLTALLEKMKEKGASVCFLEVGSKNSAAVSLYRKSGFEKIGLRKNYYQDDDAVVMKRSC